jgi:surfeit locus 1 family protein
MNRRLPIIPTIIVALAAGTMITLGFWQIQRAQQKEALLASYATAQGKEAIGFPTMPLAGGPPLFRRASGTCLRVTGWRQVAGENDKGQLGYAFLADCATGAEGPGMVVDTGWSANPQVKSRWTGGEVSGVIAPDKNARMRLVSATGLGGLQASAPPSPAMIPNNHRSYAFQWFAFAAIALIIYGLALARRNRDKAA